MHVNGEDKPVVRFSLTPMMLYALFSFLCITRRFELNGTPRFSYFE